MGLAVGSQIGAYQITSLLGAGGMGEVYRARDTRLNRDAALKVLPDAFTLDGDRLARFRRELGGEGHGLMEYICQENNQDVEYLQGPTQPGGDPDRPLGTLKTR